MLQVDASYCSIQTAGLFRFIHDEKYDIDQSTPKTSTKNCVLDLSIVLRFFFLNFCGQSVSIGKQDYNSNLVQQLNDYRFVKPLICSQYLSQLIL